MIPSATSRINALLERFQIEDEVINHSVQQAVLLLGNSGVGKTTSSYYLTNKELIGEYQNGQIVYKYKRKFLEAEIGHTNNYCTQIPNIFQQQQYGCLIDCPYFLDNFKFDRYLINAYYMHRIFSNTKKLKFIFTCNEEGLTANRAKIFLESIHAFLDLFNFNNQFTAKQLAKSTVLLVTKSCFMDINSISQILKMFINNPLNDLFQEKQKAYYIDILQYWINNKNIFLIKKAEDGKSSSNNTLLKEIQESTKYWERKVGNDNIVQMNDIHFQINQKNMKQDELELIENAFDLCQNTLEQLAKTLTDALKEIQQNILDDNYKYKFFDKLGQDMEKIISFKGKQTDHSRLIRYKQCHLRRIKMIQQMHNLLQPLKQTKNQEHILTLTKTSINKLIEYIIQYIIDTPQQQKVVSQFSYIVNRKFQEIKILQKLTNNFEKLGQDTLIQLKRFTYQAYPLIEKKFALCYELKQNKPAPYYTQLISFFNKYKDQKQILKKIYKAQCISGSIAYNEQNKQEALMYYISAVKKLEILNKDENEDYYVKVDKSLYRKVADILFEIQHYEHALKFYMVINQVAKIKVCYDQIFQSLSKQENKILNRIQKGDYLREMTLFVSAVRSYHQALGIAFQQSQYLQITNNRIFQTHQKRDQYIKQLKLKWERKEYYRRLNQIIQDLKSKSLQFKKSQHIDNMISSSEVLKINNIYELVDFSVNYEHLIQLNVSNCMLSDSHSQVFNKLHLLSLKKLDLSGNNITDRFIINIQYLLMQLISLNICFSDITNGSMRSIGYLMKECRELDVSYTKVDEKGIQYIIGLEKLEQLSIWSGEQHPDCYNQYLLKDYEANLFRHKNNMIKINEYGIKLLSKMKLTRLTVNLYQQDGNIIVENNNLKYLHINGKIDSKSIINILEINKVMDVEVMLKEILVLGKVVRGKKQKMSIEQLKKYIQDDQMIVEEIKIMGEQGYLKGQEIINKFELQSKSIGSEGAIQIARNLKCLTSLNLSSNSISKEGAIQIARNLKCLTILNLNNNSIGNEGAIQIARNLKCLTDLNLTWNSIGKEGAIQIARNLKCLTILNLTSNSIGNEGAIQIARNLKCLTSLNLTWNSIGKEGAIQIARNLKCLTSLNLKSNSIGKEGAIQIARNLKCLTNLDLQSNSISKEGAIQIARNLKCLTSLNLKSNSIGKEGAIQIARNLKCLTILNLTSNSIGKEGAIQIARNLKCLTILNLTSNSIGNEGAIQIARNLKCLTSLNLTSNSIGNEGAIQIARNLKCLTSLNLNKNSIGKEGAIQIARNLKCLTSLYLTSNSIGNEGAIQIARNLKCLTILNLTSNSIGNEGAIQIARNLKCLTSLNLNKNSIGKEGAIQIARNLKCLTNLDLQSNSIGKEGAIQIARNLKCLTSLNLKSNSIGKEGAIQIARNLKCLTNLDLQSNSISKEGAIQIARNLKCLTSLYLTSNSIGKEGAIQIARNLKCLTILNLTSNSIGNEGAIQIARNLKCLTSLNLNKNSIGKEGAIQIARNLKCLTNLDLQSNSISKEGAIQIARNLKSLTTLNLWDNNLDQQSKSQIHKLVKSAYL